MKPNFVTRFFKDVFTTLLKILRSLLVYVVVFFILMTGLTTLGGVFIQLGQETSQRSDANVIRDKGGDEKIVVYNASGIVLLESTPGFFDPSSQAITETDIRNMFNDIKKDPMVKAVIFDINSPGGSPVAADRIFELITDFKQETNVPVIFLMGDIATSGGYYIAAAGDHIVANPTTFTGSIGVILEAYNLEAFYEKIGLSKRTFKQGEFKDLLNESRDITEEEELIIERLGENAYNLFISRVAQGRDMPEDKVKELATGQIYSGSEAKDLDLIDSLGNLNEAIQVAVELAQLDTYKVVEYKTYSFFNELLGEFTSSFSWNVFNNLSSYAQQVRARL